jgi:cell division protein ZapA (FtsZ GTPase activity inhibitor)
MDNKEEKKTAEEIAEDIIDNLLCFGMSLPDRIRNRKRIVTALNVYASQQCASLKEENERLQEAVRIANVAATPWILKMKEQRERIKELEESNTRLLERVKELTDAWWNASTSVEVTCKKCIRNLKK